MPEEPKHSKYDVFITRSIYPEAAAVFSARYKSLDEIKADCIVVLDTNTLLVPYSIGKESLEQIKTTYKTLIDTNRLVIPAQVAREFAKNRPRMLTELYDKFSKRRDSQQRLDTGKYPLLADVPEYQQLLIQQDQINNSIAEYGKLLGSVLEHIQNWFWNDPVSLVYQHLFDNTVIKESLVADEDAKNDLFRSQVHKIPPAYKDAAKDDEGIGDLLIWKTILEVGAKERKSILFVSGEEKADWWYRSNNTQLYPRYELIDEFRRVTDGQTFHIVKFSKFLDLFGAGQPVVDEVKEKEKSANHQGTGTNFANVALAAVEAWLSKRFPDFTIETGLGADFIVRRKDRQIDSVVDVRALRDIFNFGRRIREMLAKAAQYIFFDAKRIFVLVTDDYEKGLSIVSLLSSRQFPEDYVVIVGFIKNDGQLAVLSEGF